MSRICMAAALLVCTWATPGWADGGFVPLFDGKSLDGWMLLNKHGEGYLVEDGDLVCPRDGGGNLLSASEYANFVLRFEFQLESGSNNGLCIRCPLEWTNLSYSGNELQIIDNSAERYKDIKSWQKHGSLYNVAGARTGHLKPVGQWNQQEVTVDGSRIVVVLNGATILDVDTSKVKDPAKLARNRGLARRHGHVGFLGHNEPIRFRNIAIKTLP